jgi:hypothetical protein
MTFCWSIGITLFFACAIKISRSVVMCLHPSSQCEFYKFLNNCPVTIMSSTQAVILSICIQTKSRISCVADEDWELTSALTIWPPVSHHTP